MLTLIIIIMTALFCAFAVLALAIDVDSIDSGCVPGSDGAAHGLACAKVAQSLQLPVTVNLSAVQQVMDGFGGAAAGGPSVWIHVMQEPQRTELVNLLFSTDVGIGMSILRSEINCGHDKNNASTAPGVLQPATNTHEPSEGVWYWQGDEGAVWLMQQAQQRGVAHLMSTAWSPPAWMKTNNNTAGVTHNGTVGYLRADMQQAFAGYLARYVS
jgi:glucuronoarabinoxylan endo-1,4-beta-xylanase